VPRHQRVAVAERFASGRHRALRGGLAGVLYDDVYSESARDPSALPDAAKSPMWTSVKAPVGH